MEVRLIAALLFVSAAFSNSHVEAQNALSMKDAVALALENRPEMRA
jgi:hypothetical protein